MDLKQIVKEMCLDMIQNNNMCKYLYWNEKRQKYYCDSIKKFIHPKNMCQAFRCVACKYVYNCDGVPCDAYCYMGARSSP